MHAAIRLKHYTYRTEDAYLELGPAYHSLPPKRHPVEMGAPEIQAFLTHIQDWRYQ